jgi:hypothetical protein
MKRVRDSPYGVIANVPPGAIEQVLREIYIPECIRLNKKSQ